MVCFWGPVIPSHKVFGSLGLVISVPGGSDSD